MNPEWEKVSREFTALTGLRLPAREANRLGDRVTRKDTLFNRLARFAFDHPERVEALVEWTRARARKFDCPQLWELHGYASYLAEDWREAAHAFMRSLELDPENLDTWLDLAFSLIHLGVSLGTEILFDHDQFIRLYREERPPRCDLFTLQRLARRIQEEGIGYRHTWRRILEEYPDLAPSSGSLQRRSSTGGSSPPPPPRPRGVSRSTRG